MKKILFFVESLHCGGAERSLVSLLNNLDYSAYEIHLMVIRKGGEFEKLVPAHLPIESFDVKLGAFSRIKYKLARLRNTDKKFHLAQLFWESCKSDIPFLKEKYDIAIAWGQGFATYFVGERVHSDKKYAWVNTDYLKVGYNPERDLPIYDKFTKVVGVSDFVKESMQKIVGTPKVISIRNIIDPEEVSLQAAEAKSLNFDAKKTNIVTVGRLAKPKGFELAVGAAKVLREKGMDFCWYIIGEGPERSQLETLIDDDKLQDHVKLLGFRANPYPYINAADIYVQTSWLEGLGRTIIEAGILCKPIVTTDFPSAYSILEHKKTGLIIPMVPEKIAAAILEVTNNHDLRNTFISNLKSQSDVEKSKTLELIKQLFEE